MRRFAIALGYGVLIRLDADQRCAVHSLEISNTAASSFALELGHARVLDFGLQYSLRLSCRNQRLKRKSKRHRSHVVGRPAPKGGSLDIGMRSAPKHYQQRTGRTSSHREAIGISIDDLWQAARGYAHDRGAH